MGNALRFLYGQCCKAAANSDLLGAHDTSATAAGVATLARDLNHYETTSQVPEGLNKHVASSKKAQANWYKKISVAWRDSKPPPKTAEEASNLIILTLKRHQKADVEGLLAFYGLPLTRGPKFELQTLPVDAKAVADGDTITVYANTVDENARKYRIRLRGIDAPESAMPYGKEAKEALIKIVQGKSLKVLIFDEDRYGRFVGDIYCNGKFIQETMLKKGLAWHYKAYDQRPELEKWEKAARAKRVGLWASSNPEMPWEWRKDRR